MNNEITTRESPRAAVDALLAARQSAAVAEQAANVCRMKVKQMERTLDENTAAYMESMRRYRQQLDRVAHIAETAQISSVIVLVCSILILFFAILRIVA